MQDQDYDELEEPGLDRFTPVSSQAAKMTRSSARRVALSIFMGGTALFAVVMGAIMTSEQVISGGAAPADVVQASTNSNSVIPPIELRQPDPEPEEEEDLRVSQALVQAQQAQPSPQTQPQIIYVPQPTPQPRQLQRSPNRAVVSAYGRMPWVSSQRRAAHDTRISAAASTTAISSFGNGSSASSSPMAEVDAIDASLSGGSSSTSGMNMNMDMDMSSGSSTVTAMSDPNGWERKDAFLNQSALNEYSRYTVSFPRSNLEIKAGTVIPCVLISGINSDLPGDAVGQVSENVWDTVSGRYLLIPRGSRVIGTYDNQVTYGQNRALIIWSRIIFPDGSSLLLDNLKGMDQSGYAGLKGQVNKHTASLITSALLVSLIGAGVEIVNNHNNDNNNNNNNNNNRSVGNILSERVASSIAEVLSQIIQREVQRQPTIKIKPGARFVVMAQHDIIFPRVWRR